MFDFDLARFAYCPKYLKCIAIHFRYYGAYANRTRQTSVSKDLAHTPDSGSEHDTDTPSTTSSPSRASWARLIKKLFETGPTPVPQMRRKHENHFCYHSARGRRQDHPSSPDKALRGQNGHSSSPTNEQLPQLARSQPRQPISYKLCRPRLSQPDKRQKIEYRTNTNASHQPPDQLIIRQLRALFEAPRHISGAIQSTMVSNGSSPVSFSGSMNCRKHQGIMCSDPQLPSPQRPSCRGNRSDRAGQLHMTKRCTFNP